MEKGQINRANANKEAKFLARLDSLANIFEQFTLLFAFFPSKESGPTTIDTSFPSDEVSCSVAYEYKWKQNDKGV